MLEAEGEFELDPEFRNYSRRIGLTDEQVDMVPGWARRIAGSVSDTGAVKASARPDSDGPHPTAARSGAPSRRGGPLYRGI